MASLRGRMTGRAADGGWENYSMADERTSIADLFFEKLQKHGKFSLKFLLVE
jgi:hypothetical protein